MNRQINVLIVGKANHLGWFEHTTNGFLEAGCQTDVFAINQLPIFNKLVMKIKQKIDIKLGEIELASTFHKKIKICKPDLIVFISAFFIPLKLYEVAKSNSIPVVAWAGDKFGFDAQIYQPYIDKFYASDSALVSQAKKMGLARSELMQFGYDKRLHYNQQRARTLHFNFIGSYTQERNEVFKQLIGYPLIIKGSGWNKLSTRDKSWIVENTTVTPVQLSDIYNTTIATLNVAQPNNIINMVNMRTFEAIACGSCIISDNVGDISLCFEPNKEILVYNTLNELIELCNKITIEPNFARQIAANGEKRVRASSYGYDDKARKILNDLLIYP